jgi:hypothetical protein
MLGLTRQLTERWSLLGTASKTWMAYSHASPLLQLPLSPGLTARPDSVVAASGGLGFQVARSISTAFTVGYSHRDSALASGKYDNFRLLGTIGYGAR